MLLQYHINIKLASGGRLLRHNINLYAYGLQSNKKRISKAPFKIIEQFFFWLLTGQVSSQALIYSKYRMRWYRVGGTRKFHLTPWNSANGTVNSNGSHGKVSLVQLHTWPHNWMGPYTTRVPVVHINDVNNLYNNRLLGSYTARVPINVVTSSKDSY